MSLFRRIKAWRILRLTKSYQKKFPATVKPKLGPGRIEPAKRVEFNKKVIKMIVRDKELAKLIISKPEENWRQEEAITEYALKKAKGNKQKAINFLEEALRGPNKVCMLGLKTIADRRKEGGGGGV